MDGGTYDSLNFEQIQLKLARSKKNFNPWSIPHKMFYNHILFKVFINKKFRFRRFFPQKGRASTYLWWYFVYLHWLGGRGGGGALTGSPPCFLLVAWESHMTPNRMAMHFCWAIQIMVKTYLFTARWQWSAKFQQSDLPILVWSSENVGWSHIHAYVHVQCPHPYLFHTTWTWTCALAWKCLLTWIWTRTWT